MIKAKSKGTMLLCSGLADILRFVGPAAVGAKLHPILGRSFDSHFRGHLVRQLIDNPPGGIGCAALTALCHEEFGGNIQILLVVRGQLKFLGHPDGLFRADLRTAGTVRASAQGEFEGSSGVLVRHADEPRGTGIEASTTADTFAYI